MPSLYIVKAKPNPQGKDRGTSQFAAEWIEFKNTTTDTIPLSDIRLLHIAYTASDPAGKWEIALDFSKHNIFLGAGQSIRVHSGGWLMISQMPFEDSFGANQHVFTGKGFIWNNVNSDSVRLIQISGQKVYEVDRADYKAYPPEGRVLQRYLNLLS